MNTLSTSTIIAIAAPLILILLALEVFALYRLAKDDAKYLPKWAWALIIIFVSSMGIGAILFLTIGREKN